MHRSCRHAARRRRRHACLGRGLDISRTSDAAADASIVLAMQRTRGGVTLPGSGLDISRTSDAWFIEVFMSSAPLNLRRPLRQIVSHISRTEKDDLGEPPAFAHCHCRAITKAQYLAAGPGL